MNPNSLPSGSGESNDVREGESDWIHEGLPFCFEEAEVWLDDDSVRRVRRAPGMGIRFLDATHPLSNVNCEPSRVKAWRVKRFMTEAEAIANIQAAMNTPMPQSTYDAMRHAAAYPGY